MRPLNEGNVEKGGSVGRCTGLEEPFLLIERAHKDNGRQEEYDFAPFVILGTQMNSCVYNTIEHWLIIFLGT